MKRFFLSFLFVLLLLPVFAQGKETTVLEVAGDLATPIKVITDNGTYNVYSTKVINDVVSVREAYDANGEQIVVPSGEYKSTSTNGVSEYTRIYCFSTLYGNNTSVNEKRSYGNNNHYINNEKNSFFSEYDGVWTNSSGRVLNVISINIVSNDTYSITSYSYLDGELMNTEQYRVTLNEQGLLEETVARKRTYDNAIRYTNSIYEVKGNTLIVHSKYWTDFYVDSQFLNYKNTGEIGSQNWYYQRK